MPVVNGAGLVGRVVPVTADRSTVQLITDPDFAVGDPAARSGVTGTARGQGRGRGPHRRHQPRARREDLPKPGTSVTTSGIDAAPFPADDPGRARSTEPEEAGGGLTLDLVVRPMADTERLAFVTVLLWEPSGVIPPARSSSPSAPPSCW